jgi:transposase-like protein
MTHHKSEDYKERAVQYYLVEDKSQEEVCKIFECSRRSLMRWVNLYKKHSNVERQNRTPTAYKVKKEHIRFIKDEINKNRTITMEDLLFLLKRKCPSLSLSRFHLNRVVNNNNITLKLTRIRHEPTHRWGKEININEKLDEFYKEISKYKIEDIICIDETSIKSLQKRNHCYSQRGKRCVIKTQSHDVFKKYTGIFAISVNGVEGWDLYEKGGINTERLVEFLEKFITEKYKNKIIILDNASAHKNDTICELVNKHNKLLYSVPYQHFRNAIENYFSMLKSKLQNLAD